MMSISYLGALEKANYLIGISREIKENPSPNKRGGALFMALGGFSEQVILAVGDIPEDKREKYRMIASEKAHRVYAHWLRGKWLNREDHVVSSYQTRDPDNLMWGGAILFENVPNPLAPRPSIISFSGLSEWADEALSFVIGHSFGLDVDKSLVSKVKDISKNPLLDDMLFRFEKEYL